MIASNLEVVLVTNITAQTYLYEAVKQGIEGIEGIVVVVRL